MQALTFSASSLSIAANNTTSHQAIEDTSITFSLSNAPGVVYIGTTIEGPVVDAAAFLFPNATTNSSGNLGFVLVSPGMLRAGTYTSRVTFEMCPDPMCDVHFVGSPKVIDVTYVISGGAFPNTQVVWTEQNLSGATLTTAETNSPHKVVKVAVSDMPFEGLWVRRSPSSTGMITGAGFSQTTVNNQTGSASGQYDVELKPPAALGSGIFTDTMDFDLCFDATCANPVPGSSHTLSLNLLIPATEGLEFTRKEMPSSTLATGVTWSAANQKLYVATNFIDCKVVEVDPVTLATNPSGAIETCGASRRLGPMAVSQDGSRLFAASRDGHFVYRLQLPSLALDKAVSLGDWMTYPRMAADLAPVAGAPLSFVVAETANNSHVGVFVYDDETPRANSVPKDPAQAFEPPRWLVPAATAGMFLSQSYGPSFPQSNTMDVLTLDADGITTTASTPTGHQLSYPKPVRVGAKLFTNDGKILDAASGTVMGTLPLFGSTVAYGMVADDARAYLYVWTVYNQKEYILKYDAVSEEVLAFAPVYGGPVFPPGTRSLTLWGDNGLALTDGAQALVFSGDYFSTYRGEPTQ